MTDDKPSVDDPLGRKLARLEALMGIARDRQEWPEGHPCRDCDRLWKDHPAEGCEGWR